MSLKSALVKQVAQTIMVKGGFEHNTMSHLKIVEAAAGTVN